MNTTITSLAAQEHINDLLRDAQHAHRHAVTKMGTQASLRFHSRLKAAAVVGLAVVIAAGALASGALAAHPHGNANYIDQHRPALTLWMQTKTQMVVFVCYKPGDHWDNVNRIKVNPNGSFSYNGPASDVTGKKARLKLSGRFVTKNEATGRWTAPCATNHHFTAIYAPASG